MSKRVDKNKMSGVDRNQSTQDNQGFVSNSSSRLKPTGSKVPKGGLSSETQQKSKDQDTTLNQDI